MYKEGKAMELSKHLIVKTNPISDSKAQVIGNGFRITVLTDRLFRVETSKTNTLSMMRHRVSFIDILKCPSFPSRKRRDS